MHNSTSNTSIVGILTPFYNKGLLYRVLWK